VRESTRCRDRLAPPPTPDIGRGNPTGRLLGHLVSWDTVKTAPLPCIFAEELRGGADLRRSGEWNGRTVDVKHQVVADSSDGANQGRRSALTAKIATP